MSPNHVLPTIVEVGGKSRNHDDAANFHEEFPDAGLESALARRSFILSG